MKRFLLTLAVTVALVRVGAAQDVRAYEGAITLPTYLLDPAEKAPIFERTGPTSAPKEVSIPIRSMTI